MTKLLTPIRTARESVPSMSDAQLARAREEFTAAAPRHARARQRVLGAAPLVALALLAAGTGLVPAALAEVVVGVWVAVLVVPFIVSDFRTSTLGDRADLAGVEVAARHHYDVLDRHSAHTATLPAGHTAAHTAGHTAGRTEAPAGSPAGDRDAGLLAQYRIEAAKHAGVVLPGTPQDRSEKLRLRLIAGFAVTVFAALMAYASVLSAWMRVADNESLFTTMQASGASGWELSAQAVHVAGLWPVTVLALLVVPIGITFFARTTWLVVRHGHATA